jgi:hypothetical protein
MKPLIDTHPDLDVVATMPALTHYPDRTKPFDIAESEVVAWLISQPSVSQWLFDEVKHMRLIVFDKASNTYRGCGVALALPQDKPQQG